MSARACRHRWVTVRDRRGVVRVCSHCPRRVRRDAGAVRVVAVLGAVVAVLTVAGAGVVGARVGSALDAELRARLLSPAVSVPGGSGVRPPRVVPAGPGGLRFDDPRVDVSGVDLR